MRKLLYILILAFSVTMAEAQIVPAESPQATITQRLGFSDVEIKYSRPMVKGRQIFGALVPYGEVWRTGANYPTFFTAKDTLSIEGHELLPDKYAFYTIPGKDEWTIIFSKNLKLWGSYGYTDSADVLRVKVKPQASAHTESFTIDWDEITPNSGTIMLKWAETKVPVKVSVNVDNKVVQNVKSKLKETTEQSWRTGIYWQGAHYLATNNLMPELAMEWIDSSLAGGQDFFNLWTKALILANTKNYKEAVKYGKEAIESGKQTPQYFTYEEAYSTEIKKWENLSSSKSD